MCLQLNRPASTSNPECQATTLLGLRSGLHETVRPLSVYEVLLAYGNVLPLSLSIGGLE